jgi:hypothetical protein
MDFNYWALQHKIDNEQERPRINSSAAISSLQNISHNNQEISILMIKKSLNKVNTSSFPE